MPPRLPPYVVRRTNRTGKDYYYYIRGHGSDRRSKAVRLPDDPRSDAFWHAYNEARGAAPRPARMTTVDVLCDQFEASSEWAQMRPATQKLWRGSLGHVRRAWGDLEVRGIEPKHVLALRDTMRDRPGAANNMLRALRSMMAWSIPRGWRSDNPCAADLGVRPLKGGDGYAPWPWDVIEAAQRELRPDLWWAVALALYTGQRVSDVLAMRWSAINAAGLIAVRQGKTGKDLLIPLHRELRVVLDAVPRRAVTILTTTEGRPWGSGFTGVWRAYRPAIVRERGLVFHGLRKSAVVMLLEAGCTDAETAAITGQSRQMVEHYARQVNQERLARAAILKWEASART